MDVPQTLERPGVNDHLFIRVDVDEVMDWIANFPDVLFHLFTMRASRGNKLSANPLYVQNFEVRRHE